MKIIESIKSLFKNKKQNYLSELGLNKDLVDFYNQNLIYKNFRINGYSFLTLAEIESNLKEDDYEVAHRAYTKFGLITIGNCINGDNIVVKPNDKRIYIIPHDDFYDELNNEELQERVLVLSPSFKDYIKGVKADSLPLDWWDVKRNSQTI